MTKGNVAAQKSSQVCALHFLTFVAARPHHTYCFMFAKTTRKHHLNTNVLNTSGSTAGVGHAELICLDILDCFTHPPKKGTDK